MKNTKFTIKNKNDNIAINIRVSKKAKRMILKFSQVDGFELVRPYNFPERKALDFIIKHEDWVLNKASLKNDIKVISLENGAEISIFGITYTITHTDNLRGLTHFDGDKIIVSGYNEFINDKIVRFLKQHIKQTIQDVALKKADLLDVKFKKISIRDTKTRWGSCSSSGNLSFSWRLVFAPFDVFEYVVCHEVAHLREMNHSKNFWSLVKQICPHYKQHKDWLKYNGASLHF